MSANNHANSVAFDPASRPSGPAAALCASMASSAGPWINGTNGTWLWRSCDKSASLHGFHRAGIGPMLIGDTHGSLRSSCVLLVMRPLRKRRTSSPPVRSTESSTLFTKCTAHGRCLVHGGRSTFGSTRPRSQERSEFHMAIWHVQRKYNLDTTVQQV